MAKYNNREYRELSEMQNLFKDPRYVRDVWRNVGNAILRNPARKPCTKYDKDGNETYDSLVQNYTYAQLHADLSQLGAPDREPTELEMILACQAVKARTDTSAAVFIRDTLGAKPVDESKVEQTSNVFEGLTDDELELLARHRAAEQASATTSASPTADQDHIVDAEDSAAEDDTDGNS